MILGLDPVSLVEAILSGLLSTSHGELHFPSRDERGYDCNYTPFHQEGLQGQNRLNVLSIYGAHQGDFIRQPHVDWDLRAAASPYNGLWELMQEYRLGVLKEDYATFEAVAANIVAVDLTSQVNATSANVALKLVKGLVRESASLGFRVHSAGRVVERGRFAGNDLTWSETGGVQRGAAELRVPHAAVVQLFASYDGNAQHFWSLIDPRTSQNARRAVYESFDSNLEMLSDFVARAPGKGNARDLETGVACLLWMLGFSVAHLGDNPRTQDAADLIAATPSGHMVVIECTTGLLKPDTKVPLLLSRANEIKAGLDKSGNPHLKVLPVMVTSKTRSDVAPILEAPEKLGVLVMTREDLEEAIPRTLLLPDPDALFLQAEETVRNGQAKYARRDAEAPELPFPK